MTNDTRALPVLRWYLRFEQVHDEAAALEAWRQMTRAQGWSPAGEPQMGRDEMGRFAIGEVVKYPGLTVRAGVSHIVVPA